MKEFTIVNGNLIKYTGDESEITIPDGVTQIVDTTSRFDWEYVGVFQSHTELTSVILPESLQFIGKKTFKNCSGLEKIIIPNSVTQIGECAFEKCTNLTEIRIPHGVTRLDLDIIRGCESLSRIYIPSSVKLLWVDYYELPKNLKQIIIDPNTELEEIENPEYFLDHEFEINPCPMIPITILKKPELKLSYFFEYCKAPEQSSAHVAAGYEKYGKSQRSRILREAEAQNKPEVIVYYEKKGEKTTERTLSPKEKAALLEKTIEKGTGEELKQVLQNYKKISNGSEMLEKTVINGDLEKLKILLDNGIEFPEETDCFFNMLRSETLSEDAKIKVSDLCLSYENLRNVTNGIAFAACVLNNKNVIDVWNSHRKPDEFVRTYYTGFTGGWHMWDWLFGVLPEDECLEALRKILQLTDSKTKPELHINGNCSRLSSPDVMKFVLDNFEIRDGIWDSIGYAVASKQNSNLKIMSEIWKDKEPNSTEDVQNIKDAIINAVSDESVETLQLLLESGWIDEALWTSYDYEYLGWVKGIFLDAIKGRNPEILEILVKNGCISYLPSSFSKSEALQTAVNSDNPGALAILEKEGWIRTASLRDKLIDQAADEKKNNALAWLLEYKNKTADPVKEEKAREQKERKILNAEVDKTDSINKDDWKTSKNPDGTYGITRYSGDNLDKFLTIPATIGKRNITAINKNAFNVWSYSSAKHSVINSKRFIIISEGITNIETNAFSFSGYGEPRAIAIPPSVLSIEKYAIHQDSGLIIFGKKGSCTEKYAETAKIRFISNEESDKPIPDFAVIDDTLIAYYGTDKNPIIPAGVKKIGDNAFMRRNDIESVTIPAGVTTIGKRSFSECRELISINIPETVTNIEENAFYNCDKLKNIVIPESVIEIGGWAFYGCSQIENITIPKGITCIEELVFDDCLKLTNIVIPSNVEKISRDAFSGCKGLSNITIPDTVKEIDSSAFEWCSKEKLKFHVNAESKALEFAQLKGFKYEVIEK